MRVFMCVLVCVTAFNCVLECVCKPVIFFKPYFISSLLSVGAFKVFVTTTPVEGGSIMRARTWIDGATQKSPIKRWIAWLLTGIASSQLASDIIIMENKIRLAKPLIQSCDGPYSRTNQWLKQV